MNNADNLQTRPLAVVTGASSGIGLELAKEFALNGYDLIVAAEDPGIREVARFLSESGVSVDGLQSDLATYSGVEELCAAIDGQGRPVEAIAINAGVGVGGADFTQTDLDAELNMIDLNVRGAVHLAKHIAKAMTERKRGKILFTSSIAAVLPAPFEAVYGGTKAFLFSFAEALRNELRDYGVTVTSLMPGPTETNFFHRAGMDDTKVGAMEKDDPADVAKQGFKALMDGDDHIVAGSWKNKAQAVAAKFMPESAKTAIHRSMSEPGSADKAH